MEGQSPAFASLILRDVQHQLAAGNIFRLGSRPGGSQLHVAFGDVDGGDNPAFRGKLQRVPFPVVAGLPDQGEKHSFRLLLPGCGVNGVLRLPGVQHADGGHDPGRVEILFIVLQHPPFSVAPGFHPVVVAPDVVPGDHARHAGRNADGAQGANEQNALPGAGNLAGLQRLLHTLVGDSPLRGIFHVQRLLDAGGYGEGGFPPRFAGGDERSEKVAELLPPFVARFVDHGVRQHVVLVNFPGNLARPREAAADVQGQPDLSLQSLFRNHRLVLFRHVGA